MNHLKSSILTAALALVSLTSANAANLTVGNIIVERIGNGSTALSNASAQIAVLEYTTTGTNVQTITFPTTGITQQTDSGSATSNGYLNSYNGFVAVTGHDSASGVTSVSGLNNKVTSIIDSTGNVATRITHPTSGSPLPFTGNNYRSAIATSSTTFYASGNGTSSTGGVWYYNGAAFSQISSTNSGQPVNLRNIEIFNNQLYVSSSTTGFLGISRIGAVGAGLPTSTGQSATLEINMGVGASPFGFVMFDTNSDSFLDTAFIADDRTAVGGGLQKWTFNGTAWSNSYSLLFDAAAGNLSANAGTGFAGIRGLTGTYDSSTGFSLFATTTEASNNRLVQILDNGTNPTTYSTLALAGANNAFRGVDINTVPEPSSATLLGLGFLALIGLRRLSRKS